MKETLSTILFPSLSDEEKERMNLFIKGLKQEYHMDIVKTLEYEIKFSPSDWSEEYIEGLQRAIHIIKDKSEC